MSTLRHIWQRSEWPRWRWSELALEGPLALILVGMLRAEEPMQVLSGPVGRERVHYEAPPRDRLDKVERVTASRDLARMEELGVIEKDPLVAGRSTRYRVRLREAKALRLVNDLKWD